MSQFHTKAVSDYITRLKQETSELAPSRETLKKVARDPEVPSIGNNPIDVNTGQVVDYERLQPYMERAGYLPAIAMKLFLEENESDL